MYDNVNFKQNCLELFEVKSSLTIENGFDWPVNQNIIVK